MSSISLPRPFQYKRWGLKGEVIDQVEYLELFPTMDFLNVIQLIKLKDGTEMIRFGYYTRPHGSKEKWRYGSQMTLTMEKNTLKKMFKKALNKKWFKDLF